MHGFKAHIVDTIGGGRIIYLSMIHNATIKKYKQLNLSLITEDKWPNKMKVPKVPIMQIGPFQAPCYDKYYLGINMWAAFVLLVEGIFNSHDKLQAI